MLEIRIEKTLSPKCKPEIGKELGFGKVFSDHMFVMNYKEDLGWYDARIVPYQPFLLDPACVVFHYAQEIFEGLKAYRRHDGKIQLFRPERNALRFQKSAERLAIPEIAVEDFIQACIELVKVDIDWVPDSENSSLYLRPFIFATDTGLGVHASKTYTFCIIASPSGSYFKGGLEPISLYVEDEYIRSAPGLTGYAKCGGNYAGSIHASELAAKKGYSQVLWLDGLEKKYVEEAGAMNVMFKISGKVYTAACNGTVLDGVTRNSCIELLNEWGIEVVEGKLAIDEVFKASKEGRLEEIFSTGTAAVIGPIKELYWKGQSLLVNEGKIGPITQRLYDTLTGIQWGKVEDTKGWTRIIA